MYVGRDKGQDSCFCSLFLKGFVCHYYSRPERTVLPAAPWRGIEPVGRVDEQTPVSCIAGWMKRDDLIIRSHIGIFIVCTCPLSLPIIFNQPPWGDVWVSCICMEHVYCFPSPLLYQVIILGLFSRLQPHTVSVWAGRGRERNNLDDSGWFDQKGKKRSARMVVPSLLLCG